MRNQTGHIKYKTNKDSISLLKLKNQLSELIRQSNMDPTKKQQYLELLYKTTKSVAEDNSDHHDIHEMSIDPYLVILVMNDQQRFYIYESDLSSTVLTTQNIDEYCKSHNIDTKNVSIICISKNVTEIQSYALQQFINIEGILFDHNERIILNDNIISLLEHIKYIKLPNDNIDEAERNIIFGYSIDDSAHIYFS